MASVLRGFKNPYGVRCRVGKILDCMEVQVLHAPDIGPPSVNNLLQTPAKTSTLLPLFASDGTLSTIRLYITTSYEEQLGYIRLITISALVDYLIKSITLIDSPIILGHHLGLPQVTDYYDGAIYVGGHDSRRSVSFFAVTSFALRSVVSPVFRGGALGSNIMVTNCVGFRTLFAQILASLEISSSPQLGLSLEENASSGKSLERVDSSSQHILNLAAATSDEIQSISAMKATVHGKGDARTNRQCTLLPSSYSKPIAAVGDIVPCKGGGARPNCLCIKQSLPNYHLASRVGESGRIPLWEPGTYLKIWADLRSFPSDELAFVQRSLDAAIAQWGSDAQLALEQVYNVNEANVLVQYRTKYRHRALAISLLPGETPIIKIYPLVFDPEYRQGLDAVLAHELGHSMGFRHEFAPDIADGGKVNNDKHDSDAPKEHDPTVLWGEENKDSIMNYFEDWSTAQVQPSDRRTLKSIYKFRWKKHKGMSIERHNLPTLSESGIVPIIKLRRGTGPGSRRLARRSHDSFFDNF